MEKIDVTLKQLRMSVSKAKVYDGCRRKFKFSYIEKLPSKDWEHFTFGSFGHKVLEDFHQYYIDREDWRGEHTPHNEVMTRSFKSGIKEYKPKLSKDMINICWEYMNVYLAKIAVYFPHILTSEEEFTEDLGNNVLLRGFIDRVQIDDDGVLNVCDYKTSKSDKYLKDDPFQLLTYAYIMLLKDPTLERVRGSYILIRDNFRYISFDFEKEEILKVKDKFLNFSVDIRAEKEYPPTATVLCNWCDYVDLCPEGKRKLFNNQPVFGAVAW